MTFLSVQDIRISFVAKAQTVPNLAYLDSPCRKAPENATMVFRTKKSPNMFQKASQSFQTQELWLCDHFVLATFQPASFIVSRRSQNFVPPTCCFHNLSDSTF